MIERDLYGASATDLLARVRRLPDAAASVMLIGHDPAIRDLALMLAGDGAGSAVMAAKYPTAGLATFGFDGRWSELEAGGTELIAFVTPKSLKQS